MAVTMHYLSSYSPLSQARHTLRDDVEGVILSRAIYEGTLSRAVA